jgi:hypothetical protein
MYAIVIYMFIHFYACMFMDSCFFSMAHELIELANELSGAGLLARCYNESS